MLVAVSFFQPASLAQQKTPNKACSGLAGFCAIYKHFSGFEFFLLPSRIHARPHVTNANRWAAKPMHIVVRWKKSQRMLEKMNLLGAIVAVAFFVSAILVFIFRLLGKPQHGHWIGYFEFLLAIPLVFLLLKAPQLERPALYYIQIGCMLAWLVVEALLDYILKIDFRNIRWMVISYVVLFFAGTGGMLGVASNAGRVWSISAIILFLIMA